MLYIDTDPTYIPNPDPDWHYTWAARDPDALADYLMSRWKLCRGAEEAKKLFGDELSSTVLTADGRICRGSMVLIKLEKSIWETYEKIDAEKRDRQRSQTQAQFHNEIDAIGHRGIRAFEMDAEEYADRREFDTRESVNRVAVSAPPASTKKATARTRKEAK